MTTKNAVAQVLKIYALINFVVCLVLSVNIGNIFDGMGIYFFAVSLVVNFVIFAFGEVVQLLHDIKINTHKQPSIASDKPDPDELPEL
ncbi:MAG: hypothetical protein CVU91_10480 [Firmicutes bacterium HGW-Firmicutes-16]|nr:MAG: hypothetical protein CVU91_10480 [Firmicutes bacterium HGW-Firmicutes-16]